ncbi:hypothetical protein U1Q18_036377 [Sarracenia purpurea var. burkii]
MDTRGDFRVPLDSGFGSEIKVEGRVRTFQGMTVWPSFGAMMECWSFVMDEAFLLGYRFWISPNEGDEGSFTRL